MDTPPTDAGLPPAPARRSRPWLVLAGAGLLAGLGLMLVLQPWRDTIVARPPTSLFAAAGIIVALISMAAVAMASRMAGLVMRSSIALAAGFGCIAVVKFMLAPIGFFERLGGGRTLSMVSDGPALIWISSFAVLGLYVLAVRLIYRICLRRLSPAAASLAPKVPTLLLIVVFVIAIGPITAIAIASGPGVYLGAVFSSLSAAGIAILLVFATILVSMGFASAEDRDGVLARASALNTALWVAIAFLVLFQALWVVFMLAVLSIWPLKTVTPK